MDYSGSELAVSSEPVIRGSRCGLSTLGSDRLQPSASNRHPPSISPPNRSVSYPGIVESTCSARKTSVSMRLSLSPCWLPSSEVSSLIVCLSLSSSGAACSLSSSCTF